MSGGVHRSMVISRFLSTVGLVRTHNGIEATGEQQMSTSSGLTIMMLMAVLVGSCGSGHPQGDAVATTSPPSSTSTLPAGSQRIDLPVEEGSTVEGLVDVDGHDLYGRCAGIGSPTVVYFTGWENGIAIDIAAGIEREVGPDVRVCSYERRNIPPSETVEGTQTPEDVIADVDGFLGAVGEDGPFLLLGASFGGLVASAYAVAHPEKVAGMILLDASTGVDYEVDEQRNFSGPCAESNRYADAWNSLEKLDNCSLATWIHERRDREPDVPLLFLAARNPDQRDLGRAGDGIRMGWVESWAPGIWRVVDEPHPMDRDDPRLVAGAIHEVIDMTD
jgi:pimeloyl-ACP methyl ester carboxylesterase